MNTWKMVGGRFENGKVSVSVRDAWDYIIIDTKEKVMKELRIDEVEYNSFWTLVCIKLEIKDEFCPAWHRPLSLTERMKI